MLDILEGLNKDVNLRERVKDTLKYLENSDDLSIFVSVS